MKKLLLSLLAVCSLHAADVSITSLPAISSVAANTVLPVVDVSGAPTTKKAQVSQLIAGLPAATGASDGKMVAADKAKLDTSTSAATASAMARRDASANIAFNVVTANTVTGLANPVNGTDATNKSYVDATSAGLIIKTPAVAATVSTNITLAGGAPTTLDSVALSVNDRVLVKNQTDDRENGIYVVSVLGSGANGTWDRSSDADTGAKLVTGSYVFVTGGVTNASAAFTMVTQGTIVIGVSHITWNLFSQVTQIVASNILGQLVSSQIQDAAINTAKFALGIAPVGLVSSLPSPSGYTGPSVIFNTSDSQLYRYTGSAWTLAVGAANITGTLLDAQIASLAASKVTGQLTDSQLAAIAAAKVTGQITTTQITDNSISTAKLQAGSVTTNEIAANTITAADIAAGTITATELSAGSITTAKIAAGAVTASTIAANTITASQIAAGAITASQIAANTITAGQIAAGAISATEIAAGAINTSKLAAGAVTASTIAANTITAGQIAAGTITADRMNVATLSAITANLGTVTAGSITASATISVGSGTTQVNISGSTFSVGVMTITDYSGTGTQSTWGTIGVHGVAVFGGSGGAGIAVSGSNDINLFDNGLLRVSGGGSIEAPQISGVGASAPIALWDGANPCYVRYDSGLDLTVIKVGVTDFINVRAGSYTSSPGVLASGFVTMKDGGGTSRNFLVQ